MVFLQDISFNLLIHKMGSYYPVITKTLKINQKDVIIFIETNINDF
jgi:hypothetical protein